MTETNPFPRLLLADLPSSWSEDDIYAWFVQFGDILSITITRDRLVSMAVIILNRVTSAIKAINSMNGQYVAGYTMRLHWVSPYHLYQIHPSQHAPNGRPPVIQVLLSYITSQMHEVIDERRLMNILCPFGIPMSVSIQKHQLSKDKASQSGYAFVYFYQTWAGLNAAAQAIVWFKKRSIDGIFFDAKFGEQYQRYLQRNLLMPSYLNLSNTASATASPHLATAANNNTSAGVSYHSKMIDMIPSSTQQSSIISSFPYGNVRRPPLHPPLSSPFSSSLSSSAVSRNPYHSTQLQPPPAPAVLTMSSSRQSHPSSLLSSVSLQPSYFDRDTFTATPMVSTATDALPSSIAYLATSRPPINDRNYLAPSLTLPNNTTALDTDRAYNNNESFSPSEVPSSTTKDL